MANKVYFYNNFSADPEDIEFRFFNQDNPSIMYAFTGIVSPDNSLLLECPVDSLDLGKYTVICRRISTNTVLGKEIIEWDGINILDISTITAKAVRIEITPELIHLISLQNGLTEGQALMILELYRLMGLDPERPLYVDATKREVLPEIKQAITDTKQNTTVRRIP